MIITGFWFLNCCQKPKLKHTSWWAKHHYSRTWPMQKKKSKMHMRIPTEKHCCWPVSVCKIWPPDPWQGLIGLGLTDLWNGVGLTKIILGSGSRGLKWADKEKHFGSQISFWAQAYEKKSFFMLTNISLGSGSSCLKHTSPGPHKMSFIEEELKE